MSPSVIYYATRSPFKHDELKIIEKNFYISSPEGNSVSVGDVCNFVVSPVATDEPLEIDLTAMVRHKARSAYRSLLMPCIVEHAGLILERDAKSGFPGGLTQPMWDSLAADGFLRRTGAAGERAVARAVVGYCDGASVRTFVGETQGMISDVPRGKRDFYWDTIFCPDEFEGKTYAEIAEEPNGLETKMNVSQSKKAIVQLAEHILKNGVGSLFGLP